MEGDWGSADSKSPEDLRQEKFWISHLRGIGGREDRVKVLMETGLTKDDWEESYFEVLLVISGFKRRKSDPCVHFRTNNGRMLVVTVFVDDFTIACDSNADLQQFLSQVSSECSFKNEGETLQKRN